MTEQRTDARYPGQWRVGITYPDRQRELLWAHDVSYNGLSLHADHSLPLGMKLHIVIFLYSDDEKHHEQVSAQAVVRHCVLDSTDGDFRIGLQIVAFEHHQDAVFYRAIEHIKEILTKRDDDAVRIMEAYSHQSARHGIFPLHRRIQFTLPNGEVLPGWTEEMSLNSMRANIAKKLELHSVHPLNLPILIPDQEGVQHVQAKAKVVDIVFRPLGTFATRFLLSDYSPNGQELLREELSLRFPNHWLEAAADMYGSAGTEYVNAEDAEALQPLAAKRKK